MSYAGKLFSGKLIQLYIYFVVLRGALPGTQDTCFILAQIVPATTAHATKFPTEVVATQTVNEEIGGESE